MVVSNLAQRRYIAQIFMVKLTEKTKENTQIWRNF